MYTNLYSKSSYIAKTHFLKYFLYFGLERYIWVFHPFNTPIPEDSQVHDEQEKYIDLTSDMTLQLEFHTKSLFDFWSGVMKEYPLICKKSMLVLLPFVSSYLCEIGFSAVSTLKTIYRSRLNFEI